MQELVKAGVAELELLKAKWPFAEQSLYNHQVAALATGQA